MAEIQRYVPELAPEPEHERLELITLPVKVYFKVIRKFFLKHNKSFRWHLGDYEKHIFFPI